MLDRAGVVYTIERLECILTLLKCGEGHLAAAKVSATISALRAILDNDNAEPIE